MSERGYTKLEITGDLSVNTNKKHVCAVVGHTVQHHLIPEKGIKMEKYYFISNYLTLKKLIEIKIGPCVSKPDSS